MSTKRSDYHFDLLEALIAQQPLAERSASRMLCVARDSGELHDRGIRDFPDLLQPNDLLVFNNTQVLKARLFGQKSSGGKIEVLIERVVDEQHAWAHVRASKAPKAGAELHLGDHTSSTVSVTMARRVGADEQLFELVLTDGNWLDVLDEYGHMPLPPYIDRADTDADVMRYQTVFGHQPGAVAAPTAGLHFDDRLLEQIRAKGVRTAEVTLHVGAGTFQPVRVDDIREHPMHSEVVHVTDVVCKAVAETKARGGRVVAVGTTVVRSLESAAAEHDGVLKPFTGETQLFLYPGKPFHVVDALLTNFHLPESTLLMLVSAFADREKVLAAYQHAVAEHYRFFSYGDAMFLA